MYEMYLAHHGILGMKWGLRRYQNKDGSLTPAGKTRYAGSPNPRHKPSSARKAAKQRAAALEKARQARAEKKVYEEARKKALESGNATEVLKYRKGSTQAELDAALRRINTERSLAEISAKEMAKGKSAVDKIIDTADTWRARGEKAIGVWNLVAKVHNSLVDEDDAWQKIGEKSVKEQKAERDKKRAEEAAKEAKAKTLAKAVAENPEGDFKYDTLNKVSDNLTSKQLKEAIESFKKFDSDKREASEKAEKEKREVSERAEKEKREASEKAEMRNNKLRDFYMEKGSINQIIANKELFTPEQLGLALTMAAEREEKEKKSK